MSEGTKELLITVAWVIGAILVCWFAFIFLIRGTLELVQEYRSFSGASISNGVSQAQGNKYIGNLPGMDQWSIYTSPTNDFSISFPGEPRTFTSTQNGIIMNGYQSDTQNEIFEVNRLTASDSFMSVDVAALTKLIQGLAYSKGQQVESLYAEADGRRIRFALKNDTRETFGIAVSASDTTVYVLQYGCISSLCSQERYQYFISHFRYE